MAHKNREKRAAKKARESARARDYYKDDYYDDEYDDYDDDYYDDDDDYYDDRRRRRRRVHPAIVAAIVTLVIIFGGYFGAQYFYENSLKPVDPGNTAEILFIIPEGSSTSEIATRLEENGLIKNAYMFRFHIKITEFDKPFQLGEHYLSKSMSVDEIIEALTEVTAVAATKTFTIIEGLTISQVAASLQQQNIVDEADFYDVVQNGEFDYEFLIGAPPGYDRLEGFLYPETYEIYEDATPFEIVDKMLQQFDMLFGPEYYVRADELGMTVREIVTLASIIERESVDPDERPIMAGVFHNRLEQGMRLESCATVQYVFILNGGEPKEFLTNEDVQIASPFNTYINDGLPPGPICSPRIQSIQAALFPDDNDYLFFVLSPELDGTHNFTNDYDEFLRFKEAYYKAVEG